MRLFFALTFNDKAKRYLMDYQKKLRKHVIKGCDHLVIDRLGSFRISLFPAMSMAISN